MVDDVADDAIDRSIRNGKVVNGPKIKLDICVAAILRVRSGSLDHRWRHVDADGLSSRADHRRSQEDIHPSTRSQIDDNFAWTDGCNGSWVPTRKTHIGFGRN